ncbi:FecR family protein [Chitinophaga costaii]|uniref:FecR family protein n=1 Tax=Chitinophaga costaii TaxID=1335309 RepID=A0A1C4EFB5_9BACT|nr:FecR family protein [Chitinophaga costaii]PUZ23861.1 FecR family protein [Chitinophaga costaii]SCC42265.1 FecR family protein [Chitinophaga costaii]
MENHPNNPEIDWEQIHQALEAQGDQLMAAGNTGELKEAEKDLLQEILKIRTLAGELKGWEEVDTPSELAALKSKLSLPNQAPVMMPVWRRALRYAAVIAILLALGGSAWLFFQPRHTAPGTMAYLTLEAPINETRFFTLPDSSKVWLNAGSRLQYLASFGKTDRKVDMTGEACFDVTADEKLPFTVRAHQQTVQVLGTLFNINAYGAHIITTLSAGKIAVSGVNANTPLQYLAPGQQAAFDTLTGQLQVSNGNPANALAWKDGQLIFTDEPLPSLLQRLGFLYGYTFIVKNDQLNDLHFNVPPIPKPANIVPLLALIKSTTTSNISFKVDSLKHIIEVQ